MEVIEKRNFTRVRRKKNEVKTLKIEKSKSQKKVRKNDIYKRKQSSITFTFTAVPEHS